MRQSLDDLRPTVIFRDILTSRKMRQATLLVGFDSAWTSANAGAIVAVIDLHDGSYYQLGPELYGSTHGYGMKKKTNRYRE